MAFPLLVAVNFWLALGMWFVSDITALATRKRLALYDLFASRMVVSHEPTEEVRHQDQQIRDRARERRENTASGGYGQTGRGTVRIGNSAVSARPPKTRLAVCSTCVLYLWV